MGAKGPNPDTGSGLGFKVLPEKTGHAEHVENGDEATFGTPGIGTWRKHGRRSKLASCNISS